MASIYPGAYRHVDRIRGQLYPRYLEYVKNGIAGGRRADLVGGGLIRSAGGWSAVKALRKRAARMKGDAPTISQSAVRGRKIALAEGLKLLEQKIQ